MENEFEEIEFQDENVNNQELFEENPIDDNSTVGASAKEMINFIVSFAIVSGFLIFVSMLAFWASDYINKTNANFYVVFEVVGFIIFALGVLGAWIIYKINKKKGK